MGDLMEWHVVAADPAARIEDQVWTLSRSSSVAGWHTDGGYDGYGLTKADAQELADAAALYRQGQVRIEALEAAAKMALETLIGCCVSAGGVDDRKTILEAQAMLRAALGINLSAPKV